MIFFYDSRREVAYSVRGSEKLHRNQSSESVEVCGGGKVDGTLSKTGKEDDECRRIGGTAVQSVLDTIGIE